MADLYDALCDADDAGLLYVEDKRPGITRRRRGKGFSYHRPDGRLVGRKERARIDALAIPPAWTDVWICPTPEGHIQATGRDEKGRKQYRYHDRWREVRDANKYGRLAEFAAHLPGIRARIDDDLAKRGLPEEKVLAAVVRLLDETLIRVGNDEYATANDSYGLTTLQEDHADVNGSVLQLEFRGKSGKEREVELRDRRLARIVQQCQELPGHDLFQYVVDDDQVVDVTSTHVNDYLRDITGATFTTKDFRTWGGTVVAAETLADAGAADTDTERKRRVLAAYDAAAEKLGNTRAVCRTCYVHPRVVEAYEEGELEDAWRRARQRAGFSRAESAVEKLLDGPPASVPD